MKKKVIVISLFLFSILIINFNFGFSIAFNNENLIKIHSEPDEDGVDDKFEDFNKRDIEIDIGSNEFTIISTRRNDLKKDQMRCDVLYDGDGITYQFQYRSNIELEFEFEFQINFYALIEFVDINLDGIYDPEIDQEVQNLTLNDFSPALYNKTNISDETDLYYFQIQTQNKNFTVHIYFAEEFTFIGNSLITPAQGKIDIEISNFNYINGSSQLALFTKLDSEKEYSKKEHTEDEENGYSTNEEGVTVSLNDYNGFFTWKKNVLIEDISNDIQIGEIMPDENVQKLYINYPRGNHSFHESKIGIEDILINDPLVPLLFLILIVTISAISTITTYSIYYSKKHQAPNKNDKRFLVDDFTRISEKHQFDDLFDSREALKILEKDEGAIEELYSKGNINITAISEDFYDVINRFDFKGNEKNELIKDLLTLAPDEREAILREMLMKLE
jgi:hypothetical protein